MGLYEYEYENECDDWGFFVEIDAEDFYKYSCSKLQYYYNQGQKRSKFINLNTIEEEEEETVEELRVITMDNEDNLENTNTRSLITNIHSPMFCLSGFIPYLCIIVTIIFLELI